MKEERYFYVPDAAVRQMLATDGPFLMECAIKEDDDVLPMTPPGMNVNDMMLEI